MSETIADAIGSARVTVELGGRTWNLEPLDFNDLSDIETHYGGGPEMLDLSKFTDQRFVLWLALRKADPGLSDEHRERCEYLLTETQVGKMIGFADAAKAAEAMIAVLRLSGLLPESAEEGETNPTTAAEGPQTKTPTRRSRKESAATSPSS